MKPKFKQIQEAAANLADYLKRIGSEANPEIVVGQAKLIHDRAQDLRQTVIQR